MKKQLFTLIAIFVGITLMSSDCGGDDDGNVSPLIGTWVMGTATEGSTNVTNDYINYQISFTDTGSYSIVIYDYFGSQQAQASGTYTDNGTSITLSAHEDLTNVSTASGLSFTQAITNPGKPNKSINFSLIKQ